LDRHPQILTTYGECESVAGNGLVLEYLPAGPVAQHFALEKYLEERKWLEDQVLHLWIRSNSLADDQLKQLKQLNMSIPKALSIAT